MAKIKITHFSDILCVWAYISEIRIDQLHADFGDRIELDFRLFPVFGNVKGKMETQWQDRGGIAAYSQHVTSVASQFTHLKINPKVWLHNPPTSSLPSHLYLSAIRIAEQAEVIDQGAFLRFKKLLRSAFFAELKDISNTDVLNELVAQMNLPKALIQEKINSGEAFAALAEDMQLAKELAVSSSPTLIFNENRQRLTGNVGYRIIEANVRELLESPVNQQSWC
ncbi:MAG: DsbA family protein [Pseudomonadales bacterium]|nr:DsbA family protein [Pseudomonadales bacterium]MCP5215324.1 DsbA family protein [Pseudomonadales bacterium]